MSKCKNKKCSKKACGSEEAIRIDSIGLGLPSWFPLLMSVCKLVLILLVFITASFQWGYTGDILWQCVWSLSLIKLVELSDE
jgi:hypothetical protein